PIATTPGSITLSANATATGAQTLAAQPIAASPNGGTIVAGTVVVTANNSSTFAPHVDSTNASLAGGSGANASNTENTSAATTVADNMLITATNAVVLKSANTFNENGG